MASNCFFLLFLSLVIKFFWRMRGRPGGREGGLLLEKKIDVAPQLKLNLRARRYVFLILEINRPISHEIREMYNMSKSSP